MRKSRTSEAMPAKAFFAAESTLGIACLLMFLIPYIVGVRPMVVMSGSMEPNIPAGSLAYVDTNADSSLLKRGDVACYEAANRTLVMHRVERIGTGGRAVFKGDANLSPDAGSVGRESIVGAYATHIPMLGVPCAWVKENFVLFALLLASLNLAVWLVDRILESKRDEEGLMEETTGIGYAADNASPAMQDAGGTAWAQPMPQDPQGIAWGQPQVLEAPSWEQAGAGPGVQFMQGGIYGHPSHSGIGAAENWERANYSNYLRCMDFICWYHTTRMAARMRTGRVPE